MAARKKIYLVTARTFAGEREYLVRAVSAPSAEKFVRGKFDPTVSAAVPSQDELLDARDRGIEIEDPDAPAAEPVDDGQQALPLVEGDA